MKRKHTQDISDDDPLQTQELTPRKRTAPNTPKSKSTRPNPAAEEASPAESPSMRLRSRTKPMPASSQPNPSIDSPTSKPKSKSQLTTPTKPRTPTRLPNGTPSRTRAADQSAKRKSARILFDQKAEGDWDGGDNLARQILDTGEENGGGVNGTNDEGETAAAADNPQTAEQTQTPRKAGRPKGSKNRRSPTPEGDIPPHERYFFQNRPGTAQTSNNTLAKLSLLTHEEYFEQLAKYNDPHLEERGYLLGLHERSFPQWRFELSEYFNVCLHGYGSKKQLVQRFADWLYGQDSESTIVIVNGYTPNITMRSILATIIEAVLGADAPSKLGTQPIEVLELLQSVLSENPPSVPITVLINSIDALPLRRAPHQSLLARLAGLRHVNILATADTPNFLLLWDVALRDEFNFVFHDCTTFAPYDPEINVVDEVHSLFGRKTRRIGGRQGVGFVLKSLPENTRKLYRLLTTEILTLLGDQTLSDDEAAGQVSSPAEAGNSNKAHDAGIEWRTLFNKASEEFISSSEMMFRTQLKEFYDHQMIVSKTDPGGGEMLGVPLSREEMEGVLEELVLE